jgi:plastocyanin
MKCIAVSSLGPMHARLRNVGIVLTLVLVAGACGGSSTKPNAAGKTDSSTSAPAVSPNTENIASLTPMDQSPETGAERLHFKVGPFTVEPGQNNIANRSAKVQQPQVDGWVVGIRPNLEYANGKTPGVDVIHLHHAVWLNLSAQDSTTPGLPERFFAVGEEKTNLKFPVGYGYAYKATDKWLLNYMIHNLTPNPDKVWVTYDIDFIPATSAAAKGIKPAVPIWMDVQNGETYPVFDVPRGGGKAGEYTYPDDATDPYHGGPAKNVWTVDRDGVLLNTAGHVHPGGLRDDMWLQRAGAKVPTDRAKPGTTDTVHLFSSVSHYYEPAGPVSWDVTMSATPDNWDVQVRKGDKLSITATYETKLASWYEGMGIMVAWLAYGATGRDPFTTSVNEPGILTHGHLPENDNHGGPTPDTKHYVDLTKLPSKMVADGFVIDVENFAYANGDMSIATTVPTIKQGQSITFKNLDDLKGNGLWHTITDCAAPCDGSSGIAYPIANGKIIFDSGELGTGGVPASGSTTWSTPTTLPPGTYTYFCRIHPFMRGAFRVVA